MEWEQDKVSKLSLSYKMRSMGRMLDDLHQLGHWIRALIGGAQPFHGWWAAIAQRHKKGGGGRGIVHEVHLSRQTPHLQYLNPSQSREGALPAMGSSATSHRRLCTAATMTAPSPLGITVPPSSNPMANSSYTKVADGLYLLNSYLSHSIC